jgi:hypothetical protein
VVVAELVLMPVIFPNIVYANWWRYEVVLAPVVDAERRRGIITHLRDA